MDVRAVLDLAMRRANLSRKELARLAGTSPSALSAYSRGVRSPTVQTLDRLLQACDLQLRVELEPYLADVDAAVDALLGAPGQLADGAIRLADALTQRGATWAFDGRTALVLHGLAAEPDATDVVLPATDETRWALHRACIEAVDTHGQPMWDGWLGSDLTRAGGGLTWSGFGPIRVRIAPELPSLVRIAAAGATYPVLPLLAVESAHPQLAEVLARLRQRRTVTG